MAEMQAITVASPGATPIVESVSIPTPGDGQILVKTLFTAINPVDDMMAGMGSLFIKSWPFTPGCDAAGTVVSVGSNAVSALSTPFKVGDLVFGCTRLGAPGYATFAEYFIFDADLCIPVPETLSIPEAAGSGVGLLTASLGVFECLNIPLDALEKRNGNGNWAIVFGAAGNIGQFALQLLKEIGFKVIGTASKGAEDLLKGIGAAAVIDYRLPEDEIVRHVQVITGGELTYALDASAQSNNLLKALYDALGPASNGDRQYSTVNAWEPLPAGDFVVKPIQLGPIGTPEAPDLNNSLRKIIPVVYQLLKKDRLKPSKYTIEGAGVGGILGAWEVQKNGNHGGVKVVIKIADE